MLSQKSQKSLSSFCLALLFVALFASEARAVCTGAFLNPVTDICWECMLPFRIGGVVMVGTGMEDSPDSASSFFCTCKTSTGSVRIGITMAYWDPAAYIETVKDPWCMPGLGTAMSSGGTGFLNGTSTDRNSSRQAPHTFAQSHYFVYPATALVEAYVDDACMEVGDFDIAYMSELDPVLNDDLASAVAWPEVLLFGNPIAQMACIADSATANAGYPLDPLFWCMGSWGSAYPVTNNMDNSSFIEANAGIAARLLFKMSRLGMLYDGAIDICQSTPTPIWYKSHFRLQAAKPVRDWTCHPIGRSGLIWSHGKNPPLFAGSSSDNFLWMVFKKRTCCVF
jgi:conjugal transfer pilus assembly protein TraU